MAEDPQCVPASQAPERLPGREDWPFTPHLTDHGELNGSLNGALNGELNEALKGLVTFLRVPITKKGYHKM